MKSNNEKLTGVDKENAPKSPKKVSPGKEESKNRGQPR